MLVDENIVKKIGNAQLFAKPFPHFILLNVLERMSALEIRKALLNETYYLEDHDLYQFERTVDLKHSKQEIFKTLKKELLSEDIIKALEKLTNLKLNRKEMDLHSLKLKNTHYLLCHDDQIEKRAIAFIIYLTPEWKPEHGGILELLGDNGTENQSQKPEFRLQIVTSLTPKWNTMVAFLVSDKSFHQISEVIGEHERLSISGWYYAQ